MSASGGKESPRDPVDRFGDRVSDYLRFRPGYPPGILEFLRSEIGLLPSQVVADVGAGTGILSEPFLRNGNIVYAVEPNDAMRDAAQARLGGDPRFRGIAGRAERTGLPDGAVDLVAVGQALHWFDLEPTRREICRILRPGGAIALVWNHRRTRGAFLEAFQAYVKLWANYYSEEGRRRRMEQVYPHLFGKRGWRRAIFDNAQEFDLEGLRGRFLSSSYAPGPEHPRHEAAMAALTELFEAHASEGRVRIEYDAEVVVGEPARKGGRS